MTKGKEITIYDIADKLKLSAATVSRALQDHPAVNKKTKKRILDLAMNLGYRTNHFARNLRNQRSRTIGVLVHELKSSFITSVLAGIEKVATAEGYDLIITHSSESLSQEIANVKNLFDKRVDGLIASLSFETVNLDHFNAFYDKGVPVVFFDRVEQDGKRTVVVIDNEQCGYIATRHLIEQGCKRIAHVTSTLKRNVYDQRFNGYKRALTSGKQAFKKELLILGDLTHHAGVEAARQILKLSPLPDGVFVTNDFLAAVVIKTLKAHGISIPGDIAVVGFNNDAIGELIEPTLTTINYPGQTMGEITARNLIDHLKGKATLTQTSTITVHSDLVIRESSLKKQSRKQTT
ncbi:MAG: LacI family transcriptional regulator [Chitinophagaceae bacterium]|nr:MAG: LacI family transcriptional regulator [Chitinophagaceae bacterium]